MVLFLDREHTDMYVLVSCNDANVEDPSLESDSWRTINYEEDYGTKKYPYVDNLRAFTVHLETYQMARHVAFYRNTTGGLMFNEIRVLGYQGNVYKGNLLNVRRYFTLQLSKI